MGSPHRIQTFLKGHIALRLKYNRPIQNFGFCGPTTILTAGGTISKFRRKDIVFPSPMSRITKENLGSIEDAWGRSRIKFHTSDTPVLYRFDVYKSKTDGLHGLVSDEGCVCFVLKVSTKFVVTAGSNSERELDTFGDRKLNIAVDSLVFRSCFVVGRSRLQFAKVGCPILLWVFSTTSSKCRCSSPN
jgi:hypothetical protein